MRFNFRIILIILAVSLFACQQDNTHDNTVEKTVADAETSGFEEFVNSFTEVKLPFYLPNTDDKNPAVKEIEKDNISNLFTNNNLQPVFGTENMTENVVENMEVSRYFSEAKISNLSGFSGLIIRKENTSNKNRLYYLFTFTSEGKYIDGICIAYNKPGVGERTASINEDMSIQIRQEAQDEGNKTTKTQSRFFELTPEGKITGIQLGI